MSGDLPIPFETEPTPIGSKRLFQGCGASRFMSGLWCWPLSHLVPRNRRSPAISASSMKWRGTNWTCSAPIPQPERTNIMDLMHIPLCELSIAKTNVRHGVKKADLADLIPSIRKRGILATLVGSQEWQGLRDCCRTGGAIWQLNPWRRKAWRSRPFPVLSWQRAMMRQRLKPRSLRMFTAFPWMTWTSSRPSNAC